MSGRHVAKTITLEPEVKPGRHTPKTRALPHGSSSWGLRLQWADQAKDEKKKLVLRPSKLKRMAKRTRRHPSGLLHTGANRKQRRDLARSTRKHGALRTQVRSST